MSVIQMDDFRRKKEKDLITPTFVNDTDFSSRMQRIKISLEKINRLMSEFKQNSKGDNDE